MTEFDYKNWSVAVPRGCALVLGGPLSNVIHALCSPAWGAAKDAVSALMSPGVIVAVQPTGEAGSTSFNAGPASGTPAQHCNDVGWRDLHLTSQFLNNYYQ